MARPVLRHWVGGRAGTRWPLPHLAGSSQGTWPVLFLHWVIYARALCCGPADAHVHLNSAHCVFRNTPPTCPRGSLALHTGICPFGLFPVALGPFQRSCLVSPELGWCGPVLLAAPTPRSCWAACALTWRVPDGPCLMGACGSLPEAGPGGPWSRGVRLCSPATLLACLPAFLPLPCACLLLWGSLASSEAWCMFDLRSSLCPLRACFQTLFSVGVSHPCGAAAWPGSPPLLVWGLPRRLCVLPVALATCSRLGVGGCVRVSALAAFG